MFSRLNIGAALLISLTACAQPGIQNSTAAQAGQDKAKAADSSADGTVSSSPSVGISGGAGSGTGINSGAELDLTGTYLIQDSQLAAMITISVPFPDARPMEKNAGSEMSMLQSTETNPSTQVSPPQNSIPGMERKIKVTAECSAAGTLTEEQTRWSPKLAEGKIAVNESFQINMIGDCAKTRLVIARLVSAHIYKVTAKEVLLFGENMNLEDPLLRLKRIK